ncbi:UNVERIFIED_CONTAM: hypothetical protein GTU68_027026 [Idotea baltica]|nr:hypothetical protein [Idotea baltica]
MRKAVRKLVMYDVPDGFSVGLVVFDSTASTKYPLKPLDDDRTRDSLGSSLPRNPSRVDKHRRCVFCGLEKSVNLLKGNGGTAGGHIVLMLAGSGHVDAQELGRIEALLADTNIILHVIVYPLTEKFPEPGGGMEIIGSRTGGLTFTIPDEGIGADSKIVMYYNLLDSLYHTLTTAAGENVLPVKVHSAEHEGGLLQNSEGSFWVDPGLGSDTVFAVFYYDLAHVGDDIHLISPHGQVIDTGNMQSENDNMNMITIRLRKNQEAHGLWHYKLENRADSHQALFVQVTSRPQKNIGGTSVTVRSWTNQMENQVNLTDIGNPLIVFAEVRTGLAAIEEAKITYILTRLGANSNGTEHEPIHVNLHDNGLLSPDIMRGDGIYSRYITGLNIGKYTAVVQVEGLLGKHTFTRHLRLGILDVVGSRPDRDVIPPSRITNLRAALLPATDGHVSFAWTTPGGDYDYGQADSYKVLVNKDLQRLRDKTGDILEGWPAPLPADSIQQHTITWKDYDKLYYLGIFAVDSNGNAALLSNVVEIFVPSPSTSAPSTMVTMPSPSKENVEVNAAGSTVIAGFDTRQLVVVFGCLAGFLLIVFLVICYCTSTHRKNKKSRVDKIQEPKDTFNVTVTVGNKGSEFVPEKHCMNDGLKKDYLRPINSWSPSELLGNHNDKRGSISGRSDNNSDHSGSTKKSSGGSSDPPQYYSNNGQYSYEGNSYNEAYPIPSDGYPTPIEGYPPNMTNYPMPKDGYPIDGGFPSYASPQPSDSFLSESCDMLPGSQGPPVYSAYPPYDNNMRGAKVPPPIPPKPKVHYIPEPYIYEGTDLNGRNSSNASVTSEKRVRNVTMV